ncbi:YafY family protein [uncultured Ferrovibrio sp.]|jgi:predicted DNA-binding transcriptional regulator YafY|uniref:helix-turn-helix transcriptional regulator n=1 Tax=uncultured Ferrovibrio sp. TaxID=1576913 RepID=UPI00261C1988|nr:YafY family protein [uncultured Ferrovibrio sp.]
MRRADRLFQIIQILRRARAPLTGEAIARELECSTRTVYRDIADLMAQRVPIRGEAGLGYVLEGGYDMPPLMLTPDEIDAAVLGAQWVSGQGDPALARAAQDLIAKIEAAVPEKLRPYLAEPPSFVSVGADERPLDRIDLAMLRAQIRLGRKLALDYTDVEGRTTRRIIWPITLGFMQTVRIIAAWCELRQDFRHFRTDRIVAAEFLEERYPQRPAALRAQWRETIRREAAQRGGQG